MRMSDIVFEALKLVIMVVVLVVARYLVPWIKTRLDADKVEVIASWAKNAVLKAQQVYSSKTGTERKAIVTEFLKEILTAKNISLSDEQLDVLIEAAVKQMKIEENSGIVIDAVGEVPETEKEE
jgi:LL-H family phage holin